MFEASSVSIYRCAELSLFTLIEKQTKILYTGIYTVTYATLPYPTISPSTLPYPTFPQHILSSDNIPYPTITYRTITYNACRAMMCHIVPFNHTASLRTQLPGLIFEIGPLEASKTHLLVSGFDHGLHSLPSVLLHDQDSTLFCVKKKETQQPARASQISGLRQFQLDEAPVYSRMVDFPPGATLYACLFACLIV